MAPQPLASPCGGLARNSLRRRPWPISRKIDPAKLMRTAAMLGSPLARIALTKHHMPATAEADITHHRRRPTAMMGTAVAKGAQLGDPPRLPRRCHGGPRQDRTGVTAQVT